MALTHARRLHRLLTILAALLTPVLGRTGPMAQPLYPNPVFEVGRSPTGLVAGDFNGDGFQDLVTSNYEYCVSSTYEPGTVSILFGRGDGRWACKGSLLNQNHERGRTESL